MAPPPLNLLGPPSLRRLPPPPPTAATFNPLPPQPSIAPPQNQPPLSLFPQKTPFLDLFFTNTTPQDLTQLLDKAWEHNPVTTLKLICILGRSKLAGKASAAAKEVFFTAVAWLHRHHPLTLACNIKAIANLGSPKNLLEILVKILENRDKREKQKGGRGFKKKKNREEREKALDKKKREISRTKRAIKRYTNDASFRFLHNQIANFFVESLNSDLRFLQSGEIEKISLISKYCPSLDSSYDKSTLICESIARKLFPKDSDSEYTEILESHYAYRVRDRLRKQVLVPLRKALEIRNGDSFVSMRGKTRKTFLKKEQRKVFEGYQRNYDKLFKKDMKVDGCFGYHRSQNLKNDDDEKFRVYLEIADGYGGRRTRLTRLPHHIVASLNGGEGRSEIAEIQWREMVEEMSKKGILKNCLAICNVSEGMKGTPLDFSIAMGLLISELNEDPWKGKVFSYGTDPKLVTIQGENLISKIEFVKNLHSGENIRFSKVFDEVLKVAVKERVSPDGMVKKILVFTDMGFEKAANNFWGVWANLSIYQGRGYMALPEVVFWNLRGCVNNPGMKHKGVTTVNGFLESAVAMFLERGVMPTLEDLVRSLPTPEEVMKLATEREDLSDLSVLD